MARIRYDFDHMKYMTLFEKITRTSIKDCIIDENQIIFIIKSDNIAKAVGKNGSNVKLLERKLRKKIKIVKFDNDCVQFTQNLLYHIKNIEIERLSFAKDIPLPSYNSNNCSGLDLYAANKKDITG